MTPPTDLRHAACLFDAAAMVLYKKIAFRFTGSDGLPGREMIRSDLPKQITDLVGGVMTPPYEGPLEISYG